MRRRAPDLLALAQRCGASVMYPTGELPRAPEVTFRPEAWCQFATALGAQTNFALAAPSPIWPIARLFIDSGGNVCSDSHLYAPGLPEGEHDVFPLPVDANATPFWCEQNGTWLYKDESRKAFKNRPLDPQPPKPPQRFMVSSIKHKAGIVTLVTINAEDVLPPLESGQEVTLNPHGVALGDGRKS